MTGAARYAADFALPDIAYAYLVMSAVARGRIRSFDLADARAVPDVLDILTHETMRDAVRPVGFFMSGGFLAESVRTVQSADIAYAGQIIAVVLANSFEAAREAANRVIVAYDEESPAASFGALDAVQQALATQRPHYEDPQVGDFAQAFAEAPAKLSASYTTQTQHHNPMELFATQCAWDGPQLTIYEATQNLFNVRNGVAAQLGIDPSLVRVINPFTGGAFGGRSKLTSRTAIIAIAARRLGRAVRLVHS